MLTSLNNLSPNIAFLLMQSVYVYREYVSNILCFDQTLFFLFSLSWVQDHSDNDVEAEISQFYVALGATSDKLRKRQMWSQVSSGLTWVYTVETTFVDTLKMAFPPSTHFTSAPFCSTAGRLKKQRGNHLQAVLPLQACHFFFHSLLPFSSRCWLPWCCWLPWSPSTRAAGCTRPGC